jgi:hypothetical protein
VHRFWRRLVIFSFFFPFFFFFLKKKKKTSNSTDGGANWVHESLPGASVVGPPYSLPGVNRIVFSPNGQNVYATSFKTGFWKRSFGQDWIWQATQSEFVLALFPHPSLNNLVAGLFLSEKCTNRAASGPCRYTLRVSGDAGNTWPTWISNMTIQLSWASTPAQADPVLFYSAHYNETGDWFNQGWYDSRLFRARLNSLGALSERLSLLDHQAGIAYRVRRFFFWFCFASFSHLV